MDQNNYIFEVEDLCKYFPAGKKKGRKGCRRN